MKSVRKRKEVKKDGGEEQSSSKVAIIEAS